MSVDGGAHPEWSRAGHQILYMTGREQIMVADYTTDENAFRVQRPRLWMQQPTSTYVSRVNAPLGVSAAPFHLTPDGKRVIAAVNPVHSQERAGNLHVTMLVNWFDELRRRLPRRTK